MSMRTHTSLAVRDTNAPKNYQMTQFAGVNIKLGAVYVLISLMHTTKKLLEASYLKNEDVTWETLDQFRVRTRPKEPVGTYQIRDAPTK